MTAAALPIECQHRPNLLRHATVIKEQIEKLQGEMPSILGSGAPPQPLPVSDPAHCCFSFESCRVGNWRQSHCVPHGWRLTCGPVKKSHHRPVIPRKTIYRLSTYLRCLGRLKDNKIQTVSSEILAKVAGVKPTQLRKDLACFGTFGTRGLGYDVVELTSRIADELGTSRLQPVILVGVGNLGRALLSYHGFEKEGFEIIGTFDIEPDRPRDPKPGLKVLGMAALPGFVREHGVRMAILTVPAEAAQEVTNLLVECGVLGILNFSPLVLHVPEEVMVNNVNLAIELENLSYFIQE